VPVVTHRADPASVPAWTWSLNGRYARTRFLARTLARPTLTSVFAAAIKCMPNLIICIWRHATVAVVGGLCLGG
jgi:hypothetical protein